MKNLIKTLLSIILVSPAFLFSEMELTEGQKAILDTLPPDTRANVLQKMQQSSQLEGEIEEVFIKGPTTLGRLEEKPLTEEEKKEYKEKSKNWVYGYELFRKAPTTFVTASGNIPVPDDYVIGPGDSLIIEIFGTQNFPAQAQYVNRSGNITVPQIGPIYVTGLNLSQARDLVDRKVSESFMSSEVFLSLGELRSINVYVLGAAYQPGAYTVSSLATVTNALFASGGVGEGGSLRSIQIKRKGDVVTTFDLYDLILKGDTSKDINLKEGDAIFIPFLGKTARTTGSFANSSLFEIKEGDNIEDLIVFSGKTKVEASLKPRFVLSRITENNTRIRKEFGLNSPILEEQIQNGDILSVYSASSIENIVVELRGEFRFPGFYNVSSTETLSGLIKRAGGLTELAYPLGAIFTRESVAATQKMSFERSADFIERAISDMLINTVGGSDVRIDSGALIPITNLIDRLRKLEPPGRQSIESDPYVIKSKTELDITFEQGDVLVMPKRPTSITVVGEVRSPLSLSFRNGLTTEDYISASGGFLDTADTDGMFLLLPNGESKQLQSTRRGIFSNSKRNQESLLPGSTIVVPRDPRPFDWLVMTKTITPILAEAATVIATIEALSDGN